VDERGRGVAHQFYGSSSCDGQVVNTGTCVILKPATRRKIIKSVRHICTAVGRDVRPLVGGSQVRKRETAVWILMG